MNSLGDRIKRYEATTRFQALPRTPLLIRVDGRAFHTYTKGMEKPFCAVLTSAMIHAAKETAKEMQGFKAAYIQSDEATFALTDYDQLTTQGWFDYTIPKIVSISASLMTAHFNHFMTKAGTNRLATFDSRAFSVPISDVANAFLWRAKDWKRNSLQMYARSFFSHKELHSKNADQIHEMLHEIGKNWTVDLSSRERNGTFLIGNPPKEYSSILPVYVEIEEAIAHLFEMPE